jgi:hypothetical protein
MRWRYPKNSEFPILRQEVVIEFYSGDFEKRSMDSDSLKEWWKRNVERWLDETESPDLPTEQGLQKEAKAVTTERFKEVLGDSWTIVMCKDYYEEGYIEGRKKNIARIKELEAEVERLKTIIFEEAYKKFTTNTKQ